VPHLRKPDTDNRARRVVTHLPDELERQLKAIANKDGISVSATACRMLAAQLAEERRSHR